MGDISVLRKISAMTPDEKKLRIISDFLQYVIGEDIDREGLQETPKRVVHAWGEFTSGYDQDPEEILSTTFGGVSYNQLVLSKDISFVSFCEHHLLPFEGKAHVAYLPKDRVVGLSKLARVVDVFAKRLQVQERMTDQIADAISQVLNPRGVAVMLEAKHSCMSLRGAKKQHSSMVTTALRGDFLLPDGRLKQEFYSMLGR